MSAKEEKDPKILELVSSIENKPSCENYERMVSGMMYDPLDPILNQGRHRARCFEVGNKKKEILQQLLGKFSEYLTILDVSLVTIGDRVQIGPNVSIYSAAHDTGILSRMKCEEHGLPVTIDDDCWIGGGTIILAGVTIGSGTTVGAGSIVTKSLPPHSVAVGNPARVIKKVQTLEEEMVISNKSVKE
ncbi:nodulation protein L [Colletotrichum acutatum]